MSQAVNKVRYQQFLRQARGTDINEIHIKRVDKRNAVVLQYNARARKSRQVLSGNWTIDRGEKDDGAILTEIKEFLARARKDFFVKRGEGLEGDALADKAMEAKAEPIVAKEDEKAKG